MEVGVEVEDEFGIDIEKKVGIDVCSRWKVGVDIVDRRLE